MKIVLLYLRIVKRVDPTLPEPFSYKEGERRWLQSYRAFKPGISHRVVVVNCGGPNWDDAFDDVADVYARYDGFGSDCGTYQNVGKLIDCDLLVCFNTISYLWRPNWLEPMVRAYELNGKGVYGVTSSYERYPHLRTPCIAFHPDIMRIYPFASTNRETCSHFESWVDNFSLWCDRNGIPSLLVTESGYYRKDEWRKPDNIFRRGDQSNCLVWDRHTDLYAKATPEEKKSLEQFADTLTVK